MANKYKSKLLLNVEDGDDHKSEIISLLKNAQAFECMVAFAKSSAWKYFKPVLKKALARGTRARIAIGLDFFHSDPELLFDLWKISSKPGSQLELFLSEAEETFHPKIYAFQYGNRCKVIVGSANFTSGGLAGNYEASIAIDDTDHEMMSSVTGHFDELVEEGVLVPATQERIARYAYEHEIYAEALRLAKRKAKNTIIAGGDSFYTLSEFLAMMKEGQPESRFDHDIATRSATRSVSRRLLTDMANWQGDPAENFFDRYGDLISSFHSGGIKRSKPFVTDHPADFTNAVTAIVASPAVGPKEAFETLYSYFKNIKGAGINLLTEILHSLDNKRFAVMNQNSVAGLRIAGFRDFASKPSKQNVNADAYQAYCDSAMVVRKKLALKNFTELDALFNYVYWYDNRDDLEEDESEEG